MLEFRLRLHWSLFLMFELTILQHWFRLWLGADQVTSHYLNQWWLVYWRIYASLRLNELIRLWETHFSEIWIKKQWFENVFCKMAAILLWPQYINLPSPLTTVNSHPSQSTLNSPETSLTRNHIIPRIPSSNKQPCRITINVLQADKCWCIISSHCSGLKQKSGQKYNTIGKYHLCIIIITQVSNEHPFQYHSHIEAPTRWPSLR